MKLYDWHKIDNLTLADLKELVPTEVLAGGKRVGLLRKGSTVYAFAALCPHAGAPFCEGWADGLGRLVCPKHKYRFDPANGRNTTGEGYKLVTYPLEIRDGELYIGLLA